MEILEKLMEKSDEATESHYRDYEIRCANYCDEHGIGELSEATLKRCFRMPREGVPVKHPNYSTRIFPATDEFHVDCTVVALLGRFCTNNGKVVFVYRDGHTYVTKGYGIIGELRAARFVRGDLFVPFSNGEQITDPDLAAKWDEIKK